MYLWKLTNYRGREIAKVTAETELDARVKAVTTLPRHILETWTEAGSKLVKGYKIESA